MSEREVDLTELLKFQRGFLMHSENIIFLIERLEKNIDIAGDLLRDDTTRKILDKMKEMSLYIKCIGKKGIDDMEQSAEKTRRLIDQFQTL